MMWVYFRRYEHYVAIDRALWRPQMAQWKRILNIGLPAGGEFAIIFVNMAVIYLRSAFWRGGSGGLWHRLSACWASFICRGYQ